MEKIIPEKFLPTHIVAAAGVVQNKKGEILLVNTYQDSWVLPGGEVEVGENLVDAVKREIFEESAWVPKEKVPDMIKAPSNRERFRAFLEYSGRPVYLEYVTKPGFELKTKRSF